MAFQGCDWHLELVWLEVTGRYEDNIFKVSSGLMC